MLNHMYASLKVDFQKQITELLKAQERNWKSHFEAKMTSIPNHALEKLKRSLALGQIYANPTFLKVPTKERSQDLQKPQKEPEKPTHSKKKDLFRKKVCMHGKQGLLELKGLHRRGGLKLLLRGVQTRRRKKKNKLPG